MVDLSGKSMLVTGAGSGIGEEVARLLFGAGANVLVADIQGDKAAAVASGLDASGHRARSVQANVAHEASVEAMVSSAVEAFGRLDGACNAAGVSQQGKLPHELDVAEWDRCHGINLRGLFLCNKHEIRAMLEGGGAIVNVVSTSALVGFPRGSEYCASKAGALGFTRGAAIDYATRGIRINALLPGGTRTPMLESAMRQDPGLEPALAAVHPMNRFAEPREIAFAVRWLLSDEASFVTGAAYCVDGGHTAI